MSETNGGDRGVSEALSFVLVFALVIGSIAIVYTVGLGGLQDARDHERINNAERAFEVFGENLDDIVLDGAPSRSTQIRMSDATLSVQEAAYVEITGTNPETGENYTYPPQQVRSLAFESGDSTVSYTGGAVVRSDGDGDGVMVREPPFLFEDDRMVLPIVRLSSGGSVAVSGDQVIQVRTEQVLRRNDPVNGTEFDSVEVNVSTDNPGAWNRYMEDSGMECEEPDPGAGEDGLALVSCEHEDVEQLRVVVIRIDVAFE
ncbi:hypothetical protein AArcSl_2049 [Halalkaliarchaeum desulfuricum]|uniref:Uncharacterized protein n=1 Tax=Halalkaliarchaeum desulfuricum TaxID=2055893 RepID=A0A343TKQ2_9EURY|nr:hypothetical protein [Halalkaliarchaeum desulfuricum]AUX09674.1 hypothetical protein AArcSl_2049 [Halalkaliarchaeum desulfuricum]